MEILAQVCFLLPVQVSSSAAIHGDPAFTGLLKSTLFIRVLSTGIHTQS